MNTEAYQMTKIKVGIVGLGELGKVHTENLHFRIQNAELVAICDNDPERVKKIKEDWGIAFGYNNLNEMINSDKIEAVIIASSSTAHREHALAAIAAGLNVFIEKPLGLNLDECYEIESAADRYDKIFTVGFMRRYDPSYSEAKKRIDQGEIGQPIFFRGYSLDGIWVAEYLAQRAASNGCWFIDMTVHDYDLARWFLGSDPENVYACGDAYIFDVFKKTNDIDNGYALMKFKNNSAAFYYSGRTAPHGAHVETEIVGTKGIIRINDIPRKNRLKMYTDKGVIEECLNHYLERWGDAYLLELQAFVDSISEKRKPLISAHDGTMATIMGLNTQKAYVSNELIRF
jgi:myo-inositol 2-dehydrogenase/D-chiro-inositol 1-dehydrogenase